MKKLILFLLLLCGNAWGQVTIDGHTYADTVHITTFPFTATTNDRAYILMGDTSGVKLQATGAIYFNNCDTCALISEGSNKYTITFDSNGTTRYGVYASNCEDLKIRRVRFDAGWGYSDTSNPSPILVNILGSNGFKIDSSYIRNTGYSDIADWANNMACIRLIDASGQVMYNNNIVACSLETKGYGFPGRNRYPQVTIMIRPRFSDATLTAGSRTDYTARVANNYIKTNWSGVFAYGQEALHGVIVVDTNTIDVAFVNESNTNFNGSYHGDGGGYGLVWLEKVFVSGNTIRPIIDTNASPPIYGGSGGFISHVEVSTVSSAPKSEVDNNDIHGFVVRSSDHGTANFVKYGVDGIKFHDNIYRATVNPSGSGEIMAGWYSHISNCEMYDNTYEAVTLNDADIAYGLRYRGIDSLQTGNTFDRELVYSNDYHVYWTPDDGDGGVADGIQNNSFNGFRFYRVDTATTMSGDGHSFFYNAWTLQTDSMVNTFADTGSSDTAWLGSLTDDDMVWCRDLSINVEDNVGGGINGTVVLVNNYGQEIYNSAVGTDGLDTSRVTYWWKAGSGDSMAFNPIIGTASYATESDVVDTFNVGATDTTVTFTFTGVAGGPVSVTKKIQGVYIRKGKL